jgi:tRNA(Ile)-lysidine synthase
MKKNAKGGKKGNRVRPPELSRKVLAALERLGILRTGVTIGVAVSGGADSVALLRLLMEVRDRLSKKHPMEIAVTHFNHQLRGRAALGDERFVRGLAKKLGMNFYLGSVDVAAAAKRAKRNVEDAGRRERYAYFAGLQREGCVDWVATAHTMDDQAETVLAHALRGSGLAGLRGIHPVTGCVMRPLLGVRRAELRAYLKLHAQKWREDASNQDATKNRARIRKTLIPLLEKSFQPKVVAHLAALAESAREDEEFLNGEAERRLAQIRENVDGVVRVAVQKLFGNREIQHRDLQSTLSRRGEHSYCGALSGRMVRKLVRECKTRDGELGAEHVASVRELAWHGENGKSLELPGGVEVRKERNTLVFLAREAASDEARPGGGPVNSPRFIEYECEIEMRDGVAVAPVVLLKRAFLFTEIDWFGERRETNKMRAVLDCAGLQFPLVLRNWRPGDRLQPAGRSRAHKLKHLLNEKGISRWERNGWPVLTSGGEVIWSRGFPVAAKYAPGEKTEAALAIDEEAL